MAKSLLNIPIDKGSINFKGNADPFESRVRKLTSKNRKNLTRVVDSGADLATVEKARRNLRLAENSARLSLATDDVNDARKAQNFHNIVITVESEKRDKANDTVRKLSGRVDSNSKTQVTFANRAAKRSSGVIKESQTSLSKIQNKLDNAVARQRQFSSIKKGTFSP